MARNVGTVVMEAYIEGVDDIRHVAHFRLFVNDVPSQGGEAPFKLFSKPPVLGDTYLVQEIKDPKPRTHFEYVPLPPYTQKDAEKIKAYGKILDNVI